MLAITLLGTRLSTLVRRVFPDRDPLKPVIAIALALLTVLATVVAAFQSNASIQATVAKRDAERVAIEATGIDASVTVRAGTEYGVFRRWFEQGQRARWAQDQVDQDPSRDDRALLEELLRIDTELEAWTQQQGELTQPPYHDADTFLTDTTAFEAEERVRPAVSAIERREVEAAVGSAWDAKATAFLTNLSIVAVGLFFLGLAATLSGRTRPFLAGAGALFGIVALGWTAVLATTPVSRVPDEAVMHVVESQVQLSYAAAQTGAEELTDDRRARLERAVSEADAAIRLDPGYLAAYLARGQARASFGESIYLSTEGMTDEARTLVQGGVDDYKLYVRERPDSYLGWGNLGAYAYHVGDPQLSLDATDRALELAPDFFVLYLNRGMARLAMGDDPGADADIEEGLRVAATRSLASTGYFFDYSDLTLTRLARSRPEQERSGLLRIQRRLREARVALHTRGSTDVPPDAPTLGGFEVRLVTLSQDGDIQEADVVEEGSEISGAEGNGFRVGLEGPLPAGTPVEVRVWVNDVQQVAYARSIEWPEEGTVSLDLFSPYGRARFDLDPGRYVMEVYVDGATRGSLTWTVGPVRPVFLVDAAELVELYTDSMTCGEPVTPPEGSPAGSAELVQCDAEFPDVARAYRILVYADEEGALRGLGAYVFSGDGTSVVEDSRAFFRDVLEVVYAPRFAEEGIEWMDRQGEEFHSIRLAGTYLSASGTDDTIRGLSISPG